MHKTVFVCMHVRIYITENCPPHKNVISQHNFPASAARTDRHFFLPNASERLTPRDSSWRISCDSPSSLSRTSSSSLHFAPVPLRHVALRAGAAQRRKQKHATIVRSWLSSIPLFFFLFFFPWARKARSLRDA